jgi:hypothetical protein
MLSIATPHLSGQCVRDGPSGIHSLRAMRWHGIGPDLSLNRPRTPDQWPDVVARPVPKFDVALLPPEQPLSVLGKGMLHSVLAFEKMLGADVSTISTDADITGAQAMGIMRDVAFDLAGYPGRPRANYAALARIRHYRDSLSARVSKTILPPTSVSTARVLGNSDGGTVKMSCDKTARSASFPAAMLPLSFSVNSACADVFV